MSNIYLGFTTEGCMEWEGQRKEDNKKIGNPIKITYPVVANPDEMEDIAQRLVKCIDAIEPDAVSVEGIPRIRQLITDAVLERDDIKYIEVVRNYFDNEDPEYSDFGGDEDCYIRLEEVHYGLDTEEE